MRYGTILICAAWLVATAAGAGQATYKCRSTAGRIAYQDTPCESGTGVSGGALDLRVDKPSAADVARIRQQTRDDRKELDRIEQARQREQAHARGREPGLDEKCAALQRQAREANERIDTRRNAGARAIEERKKKEAADRFFSECPHKVLTYR
jgi:hypothetical protein